MKAIYSHTTTLGEQFIAPLFNGDIECLSPDEQMMLEQDHHDNMTMLQEEHGENFVSVEYESVSSERFVCPCELTRKLSTCIEVKVYAMVNDGTPPRQPGIMNMDGTVEKFDGEY
jgi:hypothetical protein